MSDISWVDAFNENMAAMGLPVPSTIFAGLQTALSSAAAIVGAVKLLGAGATMAELATSFTTVVSGTAAAGIATALAEIVAIAGSVVAAFYIGAVIGSIIVATWRSNVHEMGMVLDWARRQCEILGMNLADLIRQASNAIGMGLDNLMNLFR